MADPSVVDDGRVLLLAPTVRDTEATAAILRDRDIPSRICRDVGELCREAERGAGAALVAEEHLMADSTATVAQFVRDQPTWSDFPLIVLLQEGQRPPETLAALRRLGNMTVLLRPVQIAGLVSTVEAALRDRRRQYEVRDLLVERERVAAELATSDRHKDEFLAMLAHELRNPLAALLSALSLLEQPEISEGQRSEAGRIAGRQAEMLKRLIDDLLDISRISRGKVQIQRERIDLVATVRGALQSVRHLIEGRRHELTVVMKEDREHPILGDAARIEQILVNLLANAAKYTEEGGHITLELAAEGDRYTVEVRDDGVGIAPDVLPTIFDLFSQAPRALDRSGGGLGIGLTLVKALVELHGGSVEVETELGKGTTFVVRLPAAPPLAAEPVVEEPAAAPSSPRSRRILIVDDNRDAADALGMLLELDGHHVQVTYDGLAAIELVRSGAPDVVLLDIGLPELDGLQVAQRIRGDRSMRQPVIIAVSGYSQPADRQRSRSAGCNAHLVKPIDRQELLGMLEAAPGDAAE